jgi:REP element-mobilizing transposase RayT
MGATIHSLHYHWVCSTKQQLPYFKAPWRPALFHQLSGAIRELEGKPISVGGVDDHVHALFALKTTHCIADFVRDLKKSSMAWATASIDPHFAWQEGYSIFTVSTSMMEAVATYIDRQEQHHKKKSFEAELKQLLQKHGVAYDPVYLL